MVWFLFSHPTVWQGFKAAASPFFPQPLWDGCEKIIIPQPGSAQSTPTAGHDYTITYGPAPGVTLRNELGQAAPQEMFIVLSGIQVQGTPPFQIVWFEETADDEVTLLWASIPGSTYWVQYSDSLATGSWTDIGGSS